jgi:hypothetical protein
MRSWSRYLRALSAASAILSTVAVIIGIYSFVLAQKYRRNDISFEVVPKLYDKYYEMNKIQLGHPYLAHMFASPDRYPEVAKAAAAMVSGASDKDKAKYWLEERAVADFIWTYYEQLLFQWNSTKDDEREFVVKVLDYLEDDLLRNPRLLWWWVIKGGGLETTYEDITRCEFQRNVLKKIDLATIGTLDPVGPLGYQHTPVPPLPGNLRAAEVDCSAVKPVRVR